MPKDNLKYDLTNKLCLKYPELEEYKLNHKGRFDKRKMYEIFKIITTEEKGEFMNVFYKKNLKRLKDNNINEVKMEANSIVPIVSDNGYESSQDLVDDLLNEDSSNPDENDTENNGEINLKEEEKWLRNIILLVIQCYFDHGPRSSKKVDCLHNHIKDMIDNILPEKYLSILEQNVGSCNASGVKKCDIVIMKMISEVEGSENLYSKDKTELKKICEGLNIPPSKKGEGKDGIIKRINIAKHYEPYIVFPVKFVMTNYSQNKNNNWENLLGEVTQLNIHKWNNNKDIITIPINFLFSKIPYLKKDKTIKSFEDISYEKSLKITETLTKPFYTPEHKECIEHLKELLTLEDIPEEVKAKNRLLIEKKTYLCKDIINYIIDVEQKCVIGDKYDTCPEIIGFNESTPYRDFKDILSGFLK